MTFTGAVMERLIFFVSAVWRSKSWLLSTRWWDRFCLW